MLPPNVIEKLPWDRLDELTYLLIGLLAGFALIGMDQPAAGIKMIDTITGAILMYLKGRTS